MGLVERSVAADATAASVGLTSDRQPEIGSRCRLPGDLVAVT